MADRLMRAFAGPKPVKRPSRLSFRTPAVRKTSEGKTEIVMTTLSLPHSTARAHNNLQRANCRFCGTGLHRSFIDLGMTPLCESYPAASDLNGMEPYYPLHVFVCEKCLLVQLEEYASAESIFTEYAYFSSYSDSWLDHARSYCSAMKKRWNLDENSFVVEVASNDGYLLQYFVDQNVPVLGIEPAANVARAATEKGVPTLVEFFGEELAGQLVKEGKSADLVLGNNVLAQVPDLNGFVEGLKILLKPTGVLTLEFPHLLRLIERNEFDTIYHEHFSYFSLYTTIQILAAHGLRVFDVEELTTHGGSLRVYACREEDSTKPTLPSVAALVRREEDAGLTSIDGYDSFAPKIQKIKLDLLAFLVQAKRDGLKVAGYGAPGKGTTLLHYCGITRDLLPYTVDRSVYKQGRFMPGNHIPVFGPDRISETKPDYLLILPWNIGDEIMKQMSFIRDWGGRFVVPIPELTVC
jgi:SAM-dependent methyltransferase